MTGASQQSGAENVAGPVPVERLHGSGDDGEPDRAEGCDVWAGAGGADDGEPKGHSCRYSDGTAGEARTGERLRRGA